MNKSIEIIIKPTKICNLSCSYCYVPEKYKNDQFMDHSIVHEIIRKSTQYCESGGKVNFIWHGSEPLCAGLEFYQYAVETQKKYLLPEQFSNGIQSNGTLLDNKTVEFFKENNFGIGISLDGPEYIHNKNRFFKNGSGSFHQVMKNISLLRKYDVKFGAIAVLSQINIKKARELYNFFKTEGISWKFNPLVPLPELKQYNEIAITPGEYGDFGKELFDYWYDDADESNSIYTFEQIVENILFQSRRPPTGCNFSSSCQYSFISIEPNGDIYPCGRFEGTKDLFFGNIIENDLSSIFASELKERLSKRVQHNNECQSCSFLKLCNSGCMHNAYLMSKDYMLRDGFCDGMRPMFVHIVNRLHTDLEKGNDNGYCTKTS